tara:strand:- start:916 stop:1338 length:423 start_codon:yes stop_codon:yes gene_type:complete
MNICDKQVSGLIAKNKSLDGWFVWDTSSDYIDIEGILSLDGTPDDVDWHNFYVMVSISLEHETFPSYIVVGENTGNGNNELFTYNEKQGFISQIRELSPSKTKPLLMQRYIDIVHLLSQGKVIEEMVKSHLTQIKQELAS